MVIKVMKCLFKLNYSFWVSTLKLTKIWLSPGGNGYAFVLAKSMAISPAIE